MPEIPVLPPVADAPLSVVLLLTRAEPKLEDLIAGWTAFLDERQQPYEVLLVDDATGDPALAVLPERFPHLHVLHSTEPLGEGGALRMALAEACQPLLFYTLGDARYRPADLGKLLAQIDKVHLVGAYRAGRQVPFSWRFLGSLRRVVTYLLFGAGPPPLPGWLGWKRHVGAFLSRICFGVHYRDPACPFRLIRRDIFARIPLQCNGPLVHVEIVAKANFLGCLLGEEVLLGEPDQPVVPELSVPAWRPMVREAWVLFRRPDFGPPPQPAPEALPPSEPPPPPTPQTEVDNVPVSDVSEERC